MASHRKLRAAAVVCVAAAVVGPAPVGAWAATAPATAPAAAPTDLTAAGSKAAQGTAPTIAPAALPWGVPAAVPSGAAAPLPAAPSPDPFADLTADEIADRAVTATQSATSLRMTGRVVTDDQPVDVDLALNDRNECAGRMKIAGGTADLRQTDGFTYMKGDGTFWRAALGSQGMSDAQISATIELVKGRWLKIRADQAGSGGDLGGMCDLQSLLDDLGDDKAERRGLTRGADAEVDDTPVATVVKKKAGETTTVSVAKEGKPHILKMVKTGGDEPGSIVLSDYDKPVKVEVPPADQTVDLSRLNRGAPPEDAPV